MSLEPHEEDMFAKLRETFLDDLSRTARSFIRKLESEGRSPPKTLQEIPPFAKELMETAGIPQPEETYKLKSGKLRSYEQIKPSQEIVKLGLELAKESGLLQTPDGRSLELPLRRIWYAFIKALLERGLRGYAYSKGKQEGEEREAGAADFYDGFSDIIKSSSDLWYSDYGVKNTGKMTYVPYNWKMFEPIMIGVEKTSYFDVLKNMCDMLGLALYAAGGESSVSASEEIMKRVDPLMKEGERKHLNIYAITDFDPAGYDIARNIYEHSKLFIERFGGDASFERLAPLPKHYTDVELKQGLYTMKGFFTDDHEGYGNVRLLPDIIPQAVDSVEERENEGEIDDETGEFIPNVEFIRKRLEYLTDSKAGAKNPHRKGDPILKNGEEQWVIAQGLEIESLPEEPLEELLQNPPSRMPSSYSGIARMRFIIFDDLIERHGLDTALLYLLNLKSRSWETYSGMELADKIINKDNSNLIVDDVNNAHIGIYAIKDYIDTWINEYLKDEKEAVAKQIDLWIEDVIDKYTNTSHVDYDETKTDNLKDQIRDKVYRALASNSNYISFDFPDQFGIGNVKDEDDVFYSKDFEITVPDNIINNITPIVKWAKCMEYNAETVKEYLEGLEDPLNEEWEIPPVRSCQINNDGEMEFVDTLETVGKDCTEYKTRIRKLNDEIADLEGDIIQLEKQLEEEPEQEEPEQNFLAEERLARIAELRTEKNALVNRLEDLETEYAKLNTKYRDLNDIVDRQVKEIHDLKAIKQKIEEPPKEAEKSLVDKWEEAKLKKAEKKEGIESKQPVFKYWETSDIESTDTFNQRIETYKSYILQDTSLIIQKIINENIEKMNDIYKSIQEIDIFDSRNSYQVSMFLGNLNKLSDDIKKLYYTQS